MSKNIKLSQRLYYIMIFVLVICGAVVWRASKTIFLERDQWMERVSKLKREDVTIPPLRGNIYAQDGRLMASSIPRYKAYIDFRADGLRKDTLDNNLKRLSIGLAKHFGERSPQGWANHILRGYRSRSRHFRLISRTISYTEKKTLQELPFLSQHRYRSGLILEEVAQREKPFGELASRTVGDVYGDQSKGGKNGLELAFDSLLRGVPGIGTRQKIAGRYRTLVENEPTNGVDITTTIDIDIQDITQTALLEKLLEIDAESGCAVVMETATGKIKAISNLGRMSKGSYYEMQNYAFSDISEPGSTFKVASMMVALEKDIINPEDTVDTGEGVYRYAGARMTDHNWGKGGYGKITAEEAMWFSSNIGIAKIILKGFEKNPSEFVETLYDMGVNQTFDIPIPGAAKPRIRHPKDTLQYWSRTSLPWMSFGYETQVPPIYILNFYNAIANGGKMMRPYLIENVKQDQVVLQEYEPEVLKRSICKRSTLKDIRKMLEGVVQNGTAKMVNSTRLPLAGKTGTAQISKGKGGYRSGGKSHQVSFCGYFPADDPTYSCIVVIRNPRIGYPSGGGMSGMVFKHIAERTYAQSKYSNSIERDTLHQYLPKIKNGRYASTIAVLDELDIDLDDDNKEWEWTTADVAIVDEEKKKEEIQLSEYSHTENLVPSVYGMGLKDAVYLLESVGLRVQANGKGSVYSQSKRSGSRFRRGETVVLNLK